MLIALRNYQNAVLLVISLATAFFNQATKKNHTSKYTK